MRVATIAASLLLVFGSAFCRASSLALPSAVRNGGFEALGEGRKLPDGWQFYVRRGAKASAAIDTRTRHSGRLAVRLANASPMAPHVYGRFVQSVSVEPESTYRLTVWARGRGVSRGIHFTDWKTYTLRFPSGDFEWREFTTTLTTRPGQTSLDLGLNLVDVTQALWIDDLSLTPVAQPLDFGDAKVAGAVHLPAVVEGTDDRVIGRIWIVPSPGFEGRVEVTLTVEERFLGRKIEPAFGGLVSFPFSFRVHRPRPVTLVVRLLDASGRAVAQAKKEAAVRTTPSIGVQLEEARALLEALQRRIADARRRRRPVDYSRVTATVAENFIGYVEQDIERGRIPRAAMQVDELLGILKPAVEAVEGQPAAHRYRTGETTIEKGSFVARAEVGGRLRRQPVFFNGYGHFDQVRDDIEKFPDYGINIVQVEFGPNSVLVGPDEIRQDRIEEFLALLDRAAASNVAVDLLISPHYFPQWALEKWPHLRACSGGFLKYCIDAPESRAVLKTHLETVIPRLRGKPALHSICLSNEPIYIESRQCRFTQAMWRDWLEARHGDIAALNRRYGATYASFDDVPIPDPEAVAATCHYCDWALFNARRLAGWHRWLADSIHEMAPEIPVHAKIMNTLFDRPNLRFGVDPEQFSLLSQINGNDAAKYYLPDGDDDWASGWVRENMFYDLQRSMAVLPGFNSEDHLIRDRDFKPVPAAHVRNVLWQGAVHGQGAATIWVWERTYDDESAFAGSIMHRPACAEAVGRTNLDLNRLSEYVTALQRETPQVALLYSYASIVWGDDYLRELENIYTALDLSGLRVGFVSERQLAQGEAADLKLIVVPAARAVTDETYAALRAFAQQGGTLALVGEQALTLNHWGETRDTAALRRLPTVTTLRPGRTDREVWRALPGLLRRAEVEPRALLLNPRDGKRVWGVEWQCGAVEGKLVINAVNYLYRPMAVGLALHGRARRARDLFTGKTVGPEITLDPMEPALLLVE